MAPPKSLIPCHLSPSLPPVNSYLLPCYVGDLYNLTLPPPPQLEQIRRDICDFRSKAGLDKVIVLWTANTERFCEVVPGLNDTAENLLRTIEVSVPRGGTGLGLAPKDLSGLMAHLHPQLGLEVSPSTLFAVASILEGCAFLNGSPQNTLVPGALELAWQRRVFVGGDDFKSGQTKVKSVLVDFLIGSGLKVCGTRGCVTREGAGLDPKHHQTCVLQGLQCQSGPCSCRPCPS